MKIEMLKKINIPDKPGVYFFMKDKEILYIGKATSLRERTKSYFNKDIIVTRGPMILDMVVQADNVDYLVSDNVLEALILEASLIKKHQPKYNIKEKDDKSWNYVCITKEKLPKVVVVRGKELIKEKYKDVFGPFTNGLQLRIAMKIIRKIFPFIDAESVKKNNNEFYRQLGLIPDTNITTQKEYKKIINNLKLFFQGKKSKVVQNLKKEMMLCAKNKEFERAGDIKKQLFALQHINDISLIKNDKNPSFKSFRIEAFDIAHMSGSNMVGAMTVIENGEIVKSEYKKFIIRSQSGANDTGALSEILMRRLKHVEWRMPNLIVVDGSTAQINVAKKVLVSFKLNIDIVGVVKDEKHKAKEILGNEKIITQYKRLILLANSEVHRFAIKFYREKSRKNMFS